MPDRFKLKYGFIYRVIAGEHIIFPGREAAAAVGGFFVATSSGYLVMQALRNETGIAGLVSLLTDSYEVSAERAEADIIAFLSNLSELGILEVIRA